MSLASNVPQEINHAALLLNDYCDKHDLAVLFVVAQAIIEHADKDIRVTQKG